jgi:hypothetical protein
MPAQTFTCDFEEPMIFHTSARTWVLRSLLLAAMTSGCDWTTFEEFESEASVRVYEAPSGYRRSGYGQVVTTFNGTVGGDAVGRIFASAGADAPVVMERVWDRGRLSSGRSIRCKKKSLCDRGAGVGQTLIPFAIWNQSKTKSYEACVFAPADPAGYVFCETNPSATLFVELGLKKPEKSSLNWSGASLPEKHPLGYVLIGAYALDNRLQEPIGGALYRLPPLGSKSPKLAEVKLIDPRTAEPFSSDEDSGNFGAAVATAINGAGELLIAVSQPSHGRVIVATADEDVTPENSADNLHTRACIKTPDPDHVGFGKTIAFGDVNGDGEPELFVAIDPLDNRNEGRERVYAYDGASMPAIEAAQDGVCPLWDAEPQPVGCYDGVRGVRCARGGFGASLAIGDVDGDDFNDLLVGAPLTDVQGRADAGVAWLIPGGKKGLVFDDMTNLYASSQTAGGKLGSQVAFVHSGDRDEPVAGAPGEDAVYLFTCSELERGTSSFCLPK